MQNILDLLKNNKYRHIFVYCLLATQCPLFSGSSYEDLSKEEGFMLRRITEFAKDQEYETVKKEIEIFLDKHKDSTFCDQLRGNYGDLFIQEGNYQKALEAYNEISDQNILIKFLINKMQCLYELEKYPDLIKSGSKYITKMSKDLLDRKDEFYFLIAEGFFRSALNSKEIEEKNSLLTKAMPLYEKILNSSFNDPTMFALAEIYRLQSTNDKAQSFFLELAKRHPERKEELLFHAAISQAEFDKQLAINTFSEIIKISGEKKKDATLNRLILYFQQENYDAVINNYSEVSDLIDEEKKTTLNYIIARSHFAKKSYEKATKYLNEFISENKGTQEEQRNALLMQLSTAQFLKDESLYNDTLDKIIQHFPNDQELPQAVFIHAMMLKEMGRASEAEKKLFSLMEDKNLFKDQEVLYLEYGLVSYNNENWELARKTLNTFIEKYPDSTHNHIAWKYFLSSSLNLLKNNQNISNPIYSKEEFLDDLNKVMAHEKFLDEGEKIECIFLQGKLSYELKSYSTALTHLNNFIYNHFQSEHIAEAHLLTALCHHKNGNSSDMFCTHAEKALSLDPTLRKKGPLHLELFNVYLAIAEKSQHSQNLIEKARDHLYIALSLGEKNIKLENKLWLANSYIDDLFKKPHIIFIDGSIPSNKDSFNKALSLLEETLIDPATENLKSIEENNTHLEWQILKLANLLGRKGDINKKISILKSLIEKQSHHKNWIWVAQEETLFELGKSYEMQGNYNQAFETFNFISDIQTEKRTFLQEYANFNRLRLTFQRIDKKQQNHNNKIVFDILSKLKNLQIRKNTDSEPLHLEAALEYAKIRSAITKDKNPHIKYLFFLTRIREDFNNLQDPIIEKYKKELEQDEYASSLFSQYMQFIDAESNRMEAIIQQKDNHTAMSLELLQKSEQILNKLHTQSTSTYLSNRVNESIQLLKKGTVF